MGKKESKIHMNGIREIDGHDEKDSIKLLGWFTKDKLDKKAYWTFLLILFLFYVLSNISIFFRG